MFTLIEKQERTEMLQKTVTPDLFRQFMAGMSQSALDQLPALLRGQLEAMQRRVYRQNLRHMKREAKARQYRVAALTGGGAREVARRARQIATRSAPAAL